MKNTTIRPMTVADISGLHELLKSRDNFDLNAAENRLQMLKWIAFKNPYSNGEPTYFVAEANGQIVGHLGRMPAEFIINGNRRRGYFAHDLYLHPDYRGGSGFFIVSGLYKAVEKHSNSFICLVWTTNLNLELQKRRGYLHSQCFRYYKFFNPHNKIKKIISSEAVAKSVSFFMKIFFAATDFFLIDCRPSKGLIHYVGRFDSRFDEFNDRIASKIGVCVNKTSNYLNWRYVDKPFSKMQIFSAENGGRISGYAVVNVGSVNDRTEGTLVDLMADPDDEDTIALLVREAIKWFRQANVHSIRCCMSDLRFVKILKRYLFFKDFLKTEPVMLANLEKSQDKEILSHIKNWHLMYGASDELMLE